MIVVFTSIDNGGILQLANQITEELAHIGHSVKLYVPKGALNLCARDLLPNVVEYDIPKTINPFNRELRALARQIGALEPELVIAVDDAIRANLLMQNLSKSLKKLLFVHDVTPHLQNFGLKKKLVEDIRGIYRLGAFSAADKVVLLSNHSKEKFAVRYKHFRKKSTVLPLGAHIVPAEEEMPRELAETANEDFALFFGRIDKYKGVDRLLDAHAAACNDPNFKLRLVIAGKNVSGEPVSAPRNGTATVITRYISDGEMQWLFRHCRFVVLPYYEASQSGVLPISYKYGKPVVVSDIPGLRELVEPGRTGEIFTDTEDLKEVLQKLAAAFPEGMDGSGIQAFYQEQYDWGRNLQTLIRQLE